MATEGWRRRAWTRSPGLAVVLGSLLLLSADPVFAHGEEDVPARTLVQQAIALIRSQPDQIEAILDKVHDALEAKDQKGVDLDLVREADEQLEAGDLDEAELVLQRSLGLTPEEPVVSPNPGARTPPPPRPSPTPTFRHLEELEGSRVEGAQAALFMGLAGALVLGGLALVRRFR